MTDTTDLKSANDTLASYVEEMLSKDQRFEGMSRYVYDINFYWSHMISTACAGHGFIFFNPDWWDKMVHEERKTVIAHEIWHLILNHLQRGENKDRESYALAVDHVVNQACEDDGFMTIHTMEGKENTNFGGCGMVLDKKYKGMGSDQIYKIIYGERQKNPDSNPAPPNLPSKDQIEDMVKEALKDMGSNKDLQQQIEDNEEAANQAAERGIGKEPATNRTILEDDKVRVHIQEKTYQEIFEKYLIDPLSGGKRTFMRPSRRQVKGDLRLKGKHPRKGKTNRLTHLVYALDVSGSISSHERQQFIRSANTLKETLNPKEMTVLLWGTSIVFQKTFLESEKLDNIPASTGGGTQLEPVYKAVRAINPEALVIFTDLAVRIPPKPEWETIWFVPKLNIHETYLQQLTYGEVYLIPEK